MNRKNKTIHAQILHGYYITISIIALLVAISSFCLFMINQDYKALATSRSNQISTQEAITAHYQWLDKLNISIQTGVEFTGSLDFNTCALGSWLNSVSDADLAHPAVANAEAAIHTPHETIHTLAKDILAMSKIDREAAFESYANEIAPKTREVIDLLTTISNEYKNNASEASLRLGRFIFVSLVLGLLLAVVSIVFSLTYANSFAKKIGAPIRAIADWSHQLSLGAEDIKFDTDALSLGDGNEINTMIHSFQLMAQSIQKNVNVVRRVAEGDMTAFVAIRSSQDSLGKNLYRMVQSNDHMFSEILDIAHKVAEGSNTISSVSQSLAQSANIQAQAVQDLSGAIDQASELIVQNNHKTKTATGISDHVRSDARLSTEKMQQLLASVDEISTASKKVSAVIKSIDDIAFQTNILALNAAVEAARAGEAGKGFSVVANEVRQLALNSATAVTESKKLIESTISKTEQGSRISVEAADTFGKIIGEIDDIVSLIFEISEASELQMEGIGVVRSEIAQIAQAANSNAQISTESAEASGDMRENADLLKQAMSKFTLRHRQQGTAYIPPEKQNDPDFIRKANENYQKSLKTGEVQGYIEPALI